MDYITKKVTYSQVSKFLSWSLLYLQNFGHKAINFRINERNNYARNVNGVNRRYGNNHGFVNKIYNSFSPLMDKNIVCYKCNYLGHKARDYRYMNEDVPMPTTVWRRK
jgi:hypothetical protein